MMSEVHRAFQSEPLRLSTIRDLRSGKIPLFESLKMIKKSPFLEFTITPTFAPRITRRELYHRQETLTTVYELGVTPRLRLVLKIYRIPDSQLERKSNTLPNHEIEIRYLKLFTDLIQDLVCPHFIIPVGHGKCTAGEITKLFGEPTRPTPPGTYMMILSEFADSTFFQLLQSEKLSEDAIRALLFQVITTLYIVQDIFPSFRHNDLHLSNVLVQSLDHEGLLRATDATRLVVQYNIHGQRFYLPVTQCPYRALLWDMYYSSIDAADARRYDLGQVIPSSTQLFASGDESANRSCVNQYFDLHRLFDSLEFALSQRSVAYRSSLSPLLTALIETVVPEHLKCMTRGRGHKDKIQMRLWDFHHVTPAQLLQHEYFQNFSVPVPQQTIIREYSHPRSKS